MAVPQSNLPLALLAWAFRSLIVPVGIDFRWFGCRAGTPRSTIMLIRQKMIAGFQIKRIRARYYE